jgi:hypothetical protein
MLRFIGAGSGSRHELYSRSNGMTNNENQYSSVLIEVLIRWVADKNGGGLAATALEPEIRP